MRRTASVAQPSAWRGRDTAAEILDDFHYLTNAAIHRDLVAFVEQTPASLRFVILSRNEPPLPLARARAAGRAGRERSCVHPRRGEWRRCRQPCQWSPRWCSAPQAGPPPSSWQDVYAASWCGELSVINTDDGLAIDYGRGGDLVHWRHDTFELTWRDRMRSPEFVTFSLDADRQPARLRVEGLDESVRVPQLG